MNNATVRGIVKNAPNSVIIVCVTVLAISVLGALVFLANSGKDAAAISAFVDRMFNFAMILIGSVGAVAAGAAAKSSGEAKAAAETAVTQTNGQLDARIQTAIESALTVQQEKNEENPDQGRLL